MIVVENFHVNVIQSIMNIMGSFKLMCLLNCVSLLREMIGERSLRQKKCGDRNAPDAIIDQEKDEAEGGEARCQEFGWQIPVVNYSNFEMAQVQPTTLGIFTAQIHKIVLQELQHLRNYRGDLRDHSDGKRKLPPYSSI